MYHGTSNTSNLQRVKLKQLLGLIETISARNEVAVDKGLIWMIVISGIVLILLIYRAC